MNRVPVGVSTASRISRAWRYVSADVRLRVPAPRRAAPHAPAGDGVVVCLTSFPARIGTAWKAVESILRQERPADAVVLTLSRDEFPNREIPRRLEAQRRRGLEVLWVSGNTRSHKKLIPPVRELPGATLVTADDDIFYRADWLGDLLALHRQTPRALIAHRAWQVTVERGMLRPYNSWCPATTLTPSHLIFATTGGGVLCPPGTLPEIATDEQLAVSLTPTADDIWFRAMCWLADAELRVVRDTFPDIIGPPAGLQKDPLCRINVHQNDRQLAAVLSHFGLWDRIGAIAAIS